MKHRIILGFSLTIAVVSLSNVDFFLSKEQTISSTSTLTDPAVLTANYQKWKKNHSSQPQPPSLSLSLNYAKGLSTQYSVGKGTAHIDIAERQISVQIEHLPEKQSYSAWIVSNTTEPGHTIQPEVEDSFYYIGELNYIDHMWRAEKNIEQQILLDIRPDLFIITPSNHHPTTDRLLVGMPSLFQKLYYNEMLAEAINYTTQEKIPPNLYNAFFNILGITPAQAHWDSPSVHVSFRPDDTEISSLLEMGERLFLKETFSGNGRTCASCHPAENNFTIDPRFIAQLPDDDPLFVAEFNPDLEALENSELLRKFGLIRINIDGFEDPINKHVMRAVPHTLALRTSIDSGRDDDDPNFPAQHTGWSGDGAPGGGSLREFSTGAITQHFTKTLNRTPSVDFRLPTDRELDALEAFMLSLGRQQDPNLSEMTFTSAWVTLGKELFMDNGDGGGRCQLCHENGGANFENNVNINGDTGVEAIINQPARLVDSTIPMDGGFGTDPNGGRDNISNFDGSFGNRKFNITSVIEAADTAPFFHNNALISLESAVNFYNSDAFNQATDGGAAAEVGIIDLEATEVQAITAFLRVINALENIRWSNSILSRVKNSSIQRGRELLAVAIANSQDAIDVLEEGKILHHDAIKRLRQAVKMEKRAMKTHRRTRRNQAIDTANQHKEDAAGMMLVSKS